jgi:hypothetical protein
MNGILRDVYNCTITELIPNINRNQSDKQLEGEKSCDYYVLKYSSVRNAVGDICDT